jgi:hypothetical protein
MTAIAVQYSPDQMTEMATVVYVDNNGEKFDNDPNEGDGESSNFVVGGDEEYKVSHFILYTIFFLIVALVLVETPFLIIGPFRLKNSNPRATIKKNTIIYL